jgi:hypothetical protein
LYPYHIDGNLSRKRMSEGGFQGWKIVGNIYLVFDLRRKKSDPPGCGGRECSPHHVEGLRFRRQHRDPGDRILPLVICRGSTAIMGVRQLTGIS